MRNSKSKQLKLTYGLARSPWLGVLYLGLYGVLVTILDIC